MRLPLQRNPEETALIRAMERATDRESASLDWSAAISICHQVTRSPQAAKVVRKTMEKHLLATSQSPAKVIQLLKMITENSTGMDEQLANETFINSLTNLWGRPNTSPAVRDALRECAFAWQMHFGQLTPMHPILPLCYKITAESNPFAPTPRTAAPNSQFYGDLAPPQQQHRHDAASPQVFQVTPFFKGIYNNSPSSPAAQPWQWPEKDEAQAKTLPSSPPGATRKPSMLSKWINKPQKRADTSSAISTSGMSASSSTSSAQNANAHRHGHVLATPSPATTPPPSQTTSQRIYACIEESKTTSDLLQRVLAQSEDQDHQAELATELYQKCQDLHADVMRYVEDTIDPVYIGKHGSHKGNAEARCCLFWLFLISTSF
ncbi:hypothetical protein BC940DRAFT_34477 [Gongronella butleri]|nr:hypothetical protein BC940DRAFT_34477 [Gongronella butleri]